MMNKNLILLSCLINCFVCLCVHLFHVISQDMNSENMNSTNMNLASNMNFAKMNYLPPTLILPTWLMTTTTILSTWICQQHEFSGTPPIFDCYWFCWSVMCHTEKGALCVSLINPQNVRHGLRRYLCSVLNWQGK